jgi:methionyl aminopeptidase
MSFLNKFMIKYKSSEEINLMREAAQIVSRTLGLIAKDIKPGNTPRQLDKKAEDYIRSQNALPGFLGLYGCPSTLLISVNEQVVHGLPTDRPFQEGDVVSVDCGSLYKGYYGDHAYTFEVGTVNPEVKKLLEVTKQ